MLTRSAKSVRSIRSLSSNEEDATVGSSLKDSHKSLLFEELLPYVCKKFNCEFDLFVKKEFYRDGVERYKKSDTPVKSNRTGLLSSHTSSPKQRFADEIEEDNPNVITVTSLYDSNDSLVEIFLYNQHVPRLLMQGINLISSLYEDLSKITIRNCRIDAYTIYELNKLLSITFLTDVCLDDSFIPEGNYYILLDKGTTLKQLSLCRCVITDAVCRKIVSRLHFPSPAEKNLLILNLSSNCITDEGAKSIGKMLRTNRHLRYLNLAANRIDDGGAANIFDALNQFPLTYDEIDEKRRRLIAYLKRRHALTNKFMTEHEIKIVSSNCGIGSASFLGIDSKNLEDGEDNAQNRAKKMAMHLMGRLLDPYNSNNIKTINGWLYCIGNLTLSYLNLSYNNLTYLSVKKVLSVLRYQSSTDTGLLKIILEGNYMPTMCPEYGDISVLINKKLTVHVVKEPFSRKKRASRISGIIYKK